MRENNINLPAGEKNKAEELENRTGKKKGNSGELKSVGERLKYYRQLRGRSQDWLAEKLVTTRQQIWLYEKGKAFPTSDVIENICKLLYITPNELFGEVVPGEHGEAALDAHITRVTEFAREEYERLKEQLRR